MNTLIIVSIASKVGLKKINKVVIVVLMLLDPLAVKASESLELKRA